MPRILIAGAGAVGSGVGGMLAVGGNDVTFLGRDPHMSAIRHDGLCVEGIWGRHHVPSIRALTSAREIRIPPDLVIVTVKSFDTGAVLEQIAPVMGDRTLVMSLQNGVGNAETIAGNIGWERTLAGMIIIGFEILKPGTVKVTVQADAIKVGRLDGTMDEPVERVHGWFAESGLPCDASPDVRAYLWSKVLYNAALNPLGAILRVPYGQLREPQPWQTIEAIVGEAFDCLRAAGIGVLWATAAEYLAYLRDFQIPATAEHRSSMLQDVERGRRTEVDFINGAIVDLGRRFGVATPVNEGLVSKIRELQP